MDKNTLMQNMAREAHEKGLFNGLWLYAENGEIVSKGAFGWRDAEDRLPMREDSIFQLASITKQFTAAAIMLLKRQGLLCLDDEITKFFPELSAYKGATIRHLLTHTSGVPDYYDEDDFASWFVKNWEENQRIPSNSAILGFLTESGVEPLFAPGEGFEYSNSGYNLLAEIIEIVSGVSYEDFLKENIFVPAGMNATGVRHIRRDGIPSDEYVRPMVLEDGRYVLPEDSKEHYDEIAIDALNGEAHVFSTAFDMLRWDRALREESVLTREEQQSMFTPGKLNNGEEAGDEFRGGYGFGWYVYSNPDLGKIVAHAGSMSGLGTWYERGVDADRVLVFANTRDYKDERGYWSFAEGMIAVARDKEPGPILTLEDLVAMHADPSGWPELCGSYVRTDNASRRAEVFLQDGALYWKDWNEDGEECVLQLHQIGEKEFAFKEFEDEISTEDGCFLMNGRTYKKQ